MKAEGGGGCWTDCGHPEKCLDETPLHSSAVLETGASKAMTIYDQSAMLLWVTDDRLAQFPTNHKRADRCI